MVSRIWVSTRDLVPPSGILGTMMGRLFTYELQLLVDKGENGLETRLLWGMNDSLISD